MSLLLILASTSAWAGECSGAVTAEQIGTHLEDALLAYATLDEDGFAEASTRAEEQLPCLTQVLPPARSAAFHRVMGLKAFLAGDPTASKAEFQAALAIEPDHQLSAKIAPEGGKLYRLYEEARVAGASPETFPVPRSGGRVWVDGAARNTRDPELPVVVQLGASESSITWSEWVSANEAIVFPGAASVASRDEAEDDALEDLDDVPEDRDEDVADDDAIEDLDGPVDDRGRDEPDEDEVADLDDDRSPPDRTPPDRGRDLDDKGEKGGKGGLWVGAAVTGTMAAGLYGVSAYSRSQFNEDPTAGRFHMTNGTYYGSVGMAVVTVGLAGLAVGGSW